MKSILFLQVMDGRFFAGKKLECFFWDGITNYKVEEPEEKKQRREKEFGKWLEDEDENEALSTQDEAN